ncbi:MAG: 50S ribosomal protein L16 [archaeon]
MGLRKGHCYTERKKSYTRKSKKRAKSYIKTIPPSKIAKYNMGDIHGFNKGKFKFLVSLITKATIQIRDNSLEASRQLVNRHLEKNYKTNYYFRVMVYPHHILRENKMLTGAGADRMQTGMSQSFGKPTSVAAQVKKGQKLFSVACNKDQIPFVRTLISKIRPKISGQHSIIVEEIK